MSNRARLLWLLVVTLGLAVGQVSFDTLWLIPRLHQLRVTVDNDRASAALITQQQANLLQLRQDLAGIEIKQADLEKNIWTFAAEENFFSTFDGIAKQRQVAIDAAAIADATPSGKILSRLVTLKMHGPPVDVLAAINDTERLQSLVAIQKISLSRGTTAGDMAAAVSAVTLWK